MPRSVMKEEPTLNITVDALKLIGKLILENAGGEVKGELIDVHPLGHFNF